MASVTLVESAKLSQDQLVAGVIENIVTVNPIYSVFPFQEIEGNALAYNRENVLGDVQRLAVGGTITAKAAATFTQVTTSLSTIVGDAEVNGLIQATRSNILSQKATQIASKAKSAGRAFQSDMINGDGISPNIEGLLSLSNNAATTGANGKTLDFDVMDELMDLVKSKDGQVDFFMFPARTVRAYLALLRGLGGASINETVMLPGGKMVPAYRQVPIFTNDYIPINQTKGTGSSQTTLIAGNFDDGSQTVGISGLTASGSSGIRIEDVGVSATKDETITRVKWYCGLAVFSDLALATADGITN